MYKGPEALKQASRDLSRPSRRRVPGGGEGAMETVAGDHEERSLVTWAGGQGQD